MIEKTYYQVFREFLSLTYLGTFIDITKSKLTKKELKRYQDHSEDLVNKRTIELEKRNRELQEFITLFRGRENRIKSLSDMVKELNE